MSWRPTWRPYGCTARLPPALLLTRPCRDAFQSHPRRVSPLMLWTILIILAIIALVLFILGYRRSRV